MNRHILTSMLVSGFVFSSTAIADYDLKTYTDNRRNAADKAVIDTYMLGVGRGIFWANSALRVKGDPQLFCWPDKLATDEGLVLSLLDQEIRSPVRGKPYPEDTYVELIMLRAFQYRFPCNDSVNQ